MNRLQDAFRPEEADAVLICPDCGSRVATVMKDHDFPYGVKAEQVVLTAKLPFRLCRSCGLEYLDAVGEDRMHEAVCLHLGVHTPAEIVALRERCGLSRKEFSELTKLGEATLGRWERGALIQNSANDQFLRLLHYPENIRRLRTLERTISPAPTRPAPRFQCLEADDVAARRETDFHLHVTPFGNAMSN